MNDYEIHFTARDDEGYQVAGGTATVQAGSAMEAMEYLLKLCNSDDRAKNYVAPLELDDDETLLRDIYARDIVCTLISKDLDSDNNIPGNRNDQKLAWLLLDSNNYHHARYAQTAINVANSMIRSRRNAP